MNPPVVAESQPPVVIPDYCRDLSFIRPYAQWFDAIQVLSRPGNHCLVSATGSGKTIVAFGFIKQTFYRNDHRPVLFMTPTVPLTRQQERLWHILHGANAPATELVVGPITSPAKRAANKLWQNPAITVFFATPETVLSDMNRNVLDVNQFDTIIFDEAHNAHGDYAYIQIVRRINPSGPKLILLTASPGNNDESAELVQKFSLGSPPFVNMTIPMPKRLADYVSVKLTPSLVTLDQIITQWLERIQTNLYHLADDYGSKVLAETLRPNGRWLLKHILDSASASFQQFNGESFGLGLSQIAEYRKLSYLHHVAIADGYSPARQYLVGVFKKAGLADERIRAGADDLLEILQTPDRDHPMVITCERLVNSLLRSGKRSVIVFVWLRETARMLAETIALPHATAAVLTGGLHAKQQAAIDAVKEGRSPLLISTTAGEEGLDMPEVDAVINYALPDTGTAAIQRSGRCGRRETGNVISLVPDHSVFKVKYFSIKKQLDSLAKNSRPAPAPTPAPSPPRRRRRRAPDPNQLNLGL